MQPTRPVWSVYLPVGQFAHAGWNVWSCHMPTTHAMQLDLPVVAWRHPPGHPLHALPVEYAPALHRVHPVVPPPLAHPEGQFRHELLPWSCWPGGHALQLLLPEAGCTHPLGQFRHDSPLPWSCWPAGQSLQPLAPVLLGCTQPPGHPLHVVAACGFEFW